MIKLSPTQQFRKVGRMGRSVIAYQFGKFLLPRVQYSGDISWKYRDTKSESAFLVDGVIDSSQGIIRSPISTGEMSWSGKYANTYQNNQLSSCLAQSELSGIMAQAGIWRPLVVFVQDDAAGDCENCDGYLPAQSSGEWMWTYAKIEEPHIKNQIDDILKGFDAVEVKFTLAAPFTYMTKSEWRFGSPPPVRQARTIDEMEQLISAGNTRKPRSLPDCGDSQRWYHRDPLSCIAQGCFCFYDSECLWGSINYRLMGKASLAVNVPGTFEATGYIRAEQDNTTVRIINEHYFVQTVTLNNKDTIDLDKQSVYSQCTPKPSQTSRFPRIAPGINRLEVEGRAVIGIKPRWIL